VIALIMKLRLARNQVGRDDRGVGEVFDELAADARELLTDLRDRVEALGGALRVDSEPGLGTSVRASLPVGTDHG
jgi:signal transduction histidine kinase